MSRPTDLVQGTLDLLILKALAMGPMHGWSIAQRIKAGSRDVLLVQQGSLYPALHKLETLGFIDAKWGESENNRKAKYYSLTPKGRERLEEEEANWQRLSKAISRFIRVAGEETPA
jgi:PadR family transcriptional regulator, regulatory protein PadR